MQNWFSFNTGILFKILLAGLIIYLFVQIVSRIIKAQLKSDVAQQKATSMIPISKSIIWIIFTIYSTVLILQANPITGGLIFLVLIIVSWSFIRNFVSGLVIKISGDFKLGQKVNFNNTNGTIKKLNLLSVEIEMSNGEIMLVPYFTFSQSIVIKTSPSEKILSHTFEIELDKNDTTFNLQEFVYQKVITIPWTVPNIKPKIELTKETETKVSFKILVYAIDKKHFSLIEDYVAEVKA